jgi:hypothetical protein
MDGSNNSKMNRLQKVRTLNWVMILGGRCPLKRNFVAAKKQYITRKEPFIKVSDHLNERAVMIGNE